MYVFLLFFYVISCAFGQLVPGQQCNVVHSGEIGTCKTLPDCRHLIKLVRSGSRYTRCGFAGVREVVCCPPEEDIEPTPQTVVSTTTPAINSELTKTGPRISDQKCKEYAEAVFQTVMVSVGRQSVTQKTDLCGHKVIPLVVGGEDAKVREFPHMALLGYGEEEFTVWQCGGTLVSEEYVLTAAHCTKTKLFGPVVKVRLGALNYTSTTERQQIEDFNVAQIINHPQYTTKSRYYDIALLRLDRRVNINPFKRPACLSTVFRGPEMNAIATGWGTTELSGRSSDTLQKVVLELFAHDECQEAYSRTEGVDDDSIGIIRDNEQLCAGSKIFERDTCQGDSGGPLQTYRNEEYCMYNIIGVTSFGSGCGMRGVPGVYTRVYPYLDWIEGIVWQN